MSATNDIDDGGSATNTNASAKRRSFMVGLGALVGTGALGSSARAKRTGRGIGGGRTRNLILLIPDGSSLAHDTAARYYRAYEEGPETFPLSIEDVELGVDRAEDIGYMSTIPTTLSRTRQPLARRSRRDGRRTPAGSASITTAGRSKRSSRRRVTLVTRQDS